MLQDITLYCMKTLPENIKQSYWKYMRSIQIRLYDNGFTQKDLANFLGIDPGNLSKILNCVIEPGISFYFSIDYFFSTRISQP